MVVRYYQDSRMFLSDYESLLLQREAVSEFVIYYTQQSLQDNSCGKGSFGAVEDDGAIILLFCNVPPHNLAVSIVNNDNVGEAARVLAECLGENQILINGIIAKNEVCQSFMVQYSKHISCSFIEIMRRNVLELRSINEIKPVEGSQRLARHEEAKLVAEWMIDYQMEAHISEMDYEAALEKATKLVDEEKVYFYEAEENQVVSMAIADRELIHGLYITFVFTPEAFRGKGYAAANIYYLSKTLLEKGYEFCTMLVDVENPLSNRAYEKVGYEFVDELHEYKLIQNDTE